MASDSSDSDPSTKKCLAKAIFYLRRRDHSRAEMRKKLALKGFPEEAVTDVLGRLERLGYLDDAKLARQIAQTSAHLKSFGHRRTMGEILRRGIETETAEEAIREIYSQVNIHMLALAIAIKRAPQLRKLDPPTARRRLAGFLQRRGFDYDAVRAVIDQALDE